MKFQYLISLILTLLLLCGCNQSNKSNYSPNNGVAASALAGSILKHKNVEPNTKYKRKDCPVCKGKGWYMSGDGIQKIECQYCEPESSIQAEKPPTIIRK